MAPVATTSSTSNSFESCTQIDGISLCDFTHIFHSGKFADAIVSCQNKEFRVHRAIVCPQSDFLAAAFGGNFQEAKERRLNLDDEDPETVERVLNYLYSGDYNDDMPSSYSDSGKTRHKSDGRKREAAFSLGSNLFLINANVYLLAEKLGILKLKLLAKAKYESFIPFSAPPIQVLDDFIDSISIIYEWTSPQDRLLRDVIGETCAKFRSAFMARPLFREVCAEHGDFAVEFMKEAFRLDDEAIVCLTQQSKDGVKLGYGSLQGVLSPPPSPDGIAYEEDIDVYGD